MIIKNKMSRIDNHDFLIHFTKPSGRYKDIDIFSNIVHQSSLICGNGFIKGGECCICFTETPHTLLSHDKKYFSRYSPFGIMFQKDFIFNLGGRPVKYSTEDEYDLLPNELKYRFVKMGLSSNPKIDFSWEREWRLRKESLNFTPEDAILIFPNKTIFQIFLDRLEIQISIEKDIKYEIYSSLGDSDLMETFIQDDIIKNGFNWKVIFLYDIL